MESGTEEGTSKLFVAIALLLAITLVFGLVGIAGLVFLRFFTGPVEVAMPPLEEPTSVPVSPSTPTATPVPSPTATPAAVPTATLVVSPATATPLAAGQGSSAGPTGPGMASPGVESSEMPQSGLGPLQIIGTGLALMCVLGAARIAREVWAGRTA